MPDRGITLPIGERCALKLRGTEKDNSNFFREAKFSSPPSLRFGIIAQRALRRLRRRPVYRTVCRSPNLLFSMRLNSKFDGLLGLFDFDFCSSGFNLFLISSASSLVTPSLIGLGAPSTKAFASASPKPDTAARTSLINRDLVATDFFEDHVKGSLFFDCRRANGGTTAYYRTSRDRYWSCRTDSPLFF